MTTDDAPLSLTEKIARARATAAARAAQQDAPAQQAASAASPASAVAVAAPTAAPALYAARQEPASSTPSGTLTAQQMLIWGIVRAAQIAGAKDLTRSEIRERWEAQSGTRQSDGTVAGRVNEMVRGRKAKGWLQERTAKRPCAATGNDAVPVYVPQHLLNASPTTRGG